MDDLDFEKFAKSNMRAVIVLAILKLIAWVALTSGVVIIAEPIVHSVLQ